MPGWDAEFIGSAIQHSLLPAVTILISSVSGWILGMRNMMVTVASEDYITVAHAKGLSERRVMLGYAARNALLPNVSGFALSLGFIVGGTLLVEIVFSYPGVGLQALPGRRREGLPADAGHLPGHHASVLVANLLADVAYLLLDPRTRRRAEMTVTHLATIAHGRRPVRRRWPSRAGRLEGAAPVPVRGQRARPRPA